jgi:hypothetical protein
LVDDRVLFNLSSGDGEWIGVDLVMDPDVVKFCVSAFEAAWDRGVDHDAYRPT